jgi:hypothetical protein
MGNIRREHKEESIRRKAYGGNHMEESTKRGYGSFTNNKKKLHFTGKGISWLNTRQWQCRSF